MRNIKKLSIGNIVDRNDDNDKYLFLNEKTIGFRKDKKLYKFVGLRNGYDKQFEMTLKSIKIDGVEKISSNRQYFTTISDDNDIKHTINDIEIYNEVSGFNYRNFIKITENFSSFEIIYELHLKNLNIDINNNENELIPIYDYQYNNEFIIDNPIIKDIYGKIIPNKVKHLVYEQDGIIYYKKCIDDNKDEYNFPIYIDANITYFMSNYGILMSRFSGTGYTNTELLENALDGNGLVSEISGNYIPTYDITGNMASVFRFYFIFNPFNLTDYDEIISAKLNIVTNYSLSNTDLIVSYGTNSDLTTVDWNTFNDSMIDNIIINGDGYYTLDVSRLIKKNKPNTFFIRFYTADYNRDVLEGLNHQSYFSFISLDVYYETVSNNKKIRIPLSENGTGIISSFSQNNGNLPAYYNCLSGSNLTIPHNDITTNYNKSIYYKKNYSAPSDAYEYTINRTFLSFDTSYLEPFINDTVNNIILHINIPNTTINDIMLLKGDHNGSIPLTINSWNERDIGIKRITLPTSSEELFISIPRNTISFNDYSTFVLTSYFYDYQGSGGVIPTYYDINTEIEFSTIYLEIQIESHRIYGQTYKKVEFNKDFILTAYHNTDAGVVKWYNDESLTNEIASGATINLNSKELEDNGIYNIYAILVDNLNNQISINTLSVGIEIINYNYKKLELRNNNIIPMSLDNVYFKYYNCLDGACFNYVRKTNDVYEENIFVSDGKNGSYSLYTEYDIINEFFSNNYFADVIINENIDITKLHRSLDNVYLVEGSKILLNNQNNKSENGIYIVNNNGGIQKTDDFIEENDIFRSKVHIRNGSKSDIEYHGYKLESNILNGRIYNWIAVNNSNGFAPYGLRVATEADWIELKTYITNDGFSGNEGYAIKSLKYWNDFGNGIDKYGLNILPSGYRARNGQFLYLNERSHFWAGDFTYEITIENNIFSIVSSPTFDDLGFYIRMIADSTIYSEGDYYIDLDGNLYDIIKIGNQLWFAQNWACTKYKNGIDIPNITQNNAWFNDTDGAYCDYNNDEKNTFKIL